MKTVFSLMMIALCLAACEEKEMPRTAEPTAAQRVCKADVDCILVNISCDGCCAREAINKADSAGYAARKTKLCVGKLTSVCDCTSEPAVGKCVRSKCELQVVGQAE